MADTEFEGFSNAPVKEDGTVVDFRDVPRYEDTSDAGKVREASQTTKSSIVDFKTEGKGTNGAPAAVVPAPKDPEEAAEPAQEAEGEEDPGQAGDESPAEPGGTDS